MPRGGMTAAESPYGVDHTRTWVEEIEASEEEEKVEEENMQRCTMQTVGYWA